MNHMHLLAQIKLRETERQRDRLHRHYDVIEERAAKALDPLDRLRVLHDGLREVTFAQKPLHPDVANLDALYLADRLGPVPPELIADRTGLLERELNQGRLRAEFTYAFGRILSEWTGPRSNAEQGPPPLSSDPLALLWDEAPAHDTAWLEGFCHTFRNVLAPIVERVQTFAESKALRPVTTDEVLFLLRRLRSDRHALPVLRRQAEAVSNSVPQMNEYAGALTILLNNLDEWDWPAEGLPLRAIWSWLKYRPYLDEDLITAQFLQLIGLRWGTCLRALLVWTALRDGTDRYFRSEPPTSITSGIFEHRLREQASRFLTAVPPGYPERAHGSARDIYGPDALLDMFCTLEREKRFARAAFPDRPLCLVQLDLRDYYPSLSHGLILDLLQKLGVPERWRSFFRRFLAVRARHANEVRTVRRGLVLEHVLSDLVGECVLFLLDLHLHQTSGLLPLRTVDDIWLLTDGEDQARSAMRAVETFCQACGLSINETKSGSVRLGHQEALNDLPPGRPRWGLLRLHPDDSWQVDEPAFAQVEAVLRARAEQTPSVLELVSCYNSYLRYILHQLALSVRLPGDHLRRMGQRLNQMHESLFGPGHGLVEEVRSRLKGSFADARLKERGLPAALLYWPITAGGLALAHPLLHVAVFLHDSEEQTRWSMPDRDTIAAYLWRYQKNPRRSPLSRPELLLFFPAPGRRPPELRQEDFEAYARARDRGEATLPTPEDIDLVLAQLWTIFYTESVATNRERGPAPLPAMERMVNDFIQRGSEVSGQHQAGLSAYWRWVLYTYGPSLLDALGTFRFLLTELVPLQLILEHRGGIGSETETREANPIPLPYHLDTPPPSPPPREDPGEDIPF